MPMIRISKPLKREISIEGQAYTLIVSDYGLVLVKKRYREGVELSWKQVLSIDPPHE